MGNEAYAAGCNPTCSVYVTLLQVGQYKLRNVASVSNTQILITGKQENKGGVFKCILKPIRVFQCNMMFIHHRLVFLVIQINVILNTS